MSSDVECKVCGSHNDAWLCKPCTTELEQHIAELPSALNNLHAVETRQAAGPLGLGHQSRQWDAPPEDLARPVTPWPYSPGAADQLWVIENDVYTWAKHLSESRGLPMPETPVEIQRRFRVAPTGAVTVVRRPSPTQTQTLVAWLLLNIEAIRFDVAAADIHDAFANLAEDNKLAILGPGEQRFYGRCDLTNVILDDGTPGVIRPELVACGARLYGLLDAKSIRCKTCGATYDTKNRRSSMLDRINDEWRTAHAIAHAVTFGDEPLNPATLRSWISRDKATHEAGRRFRWPPILQVGIDDEERPLYRVGDVRARIAAVREAGKGERMSA